MAVSVETDLDLGSWTVTEDRVQRYLEAVGDNQPEYFEYSLAPPVALSAWALGSLLDKLALPSGAVHSLQELETSRGVKFGEVIQVTANFGKPRQRGNMIFLSVGYTLRDSAGQQVQHGKSTVLSTSVDDAEPVAKPVDRPSLARKSPQPTFEKGGEGGFVSHTNPTPSSPAENPQSVSLPGQSRTISQDQLIAYAHASGDHNPLHLDPGFASGTQFGGVIAHGMLTLGFISEMMAGAFKRPWLESGALTVRFKGAVYLGDQVEPWGRVSKEKLHSKGRLVVCSVGVRNLQTGQELITGTSTVTIGDF